MAHSIPVDIPSPVFAEHGCIFHVLSLIECRLRTNAIYHQIKQITRTSSPCKDIGRSCLFAMISSGTPANLTSSSNAYNSLPLFINNSILITFLPTASYQRNQLQISTRPWLQSNFSSMV